MKGLAPKLFAYTLEAIVTDKIGTILSTTRTEPRDISSLSILPAGQTEFNPVTLLGSSMMEEVINMAKQKYELVFVDGANLKDFKDSAVLSAYLDGTCLVINEGKTRRQVVKSAMVPLEQKKVNLIGVILNNRSFVIPKMIYERV